MKALINSLGKWERIVIVSVLIISLFYIVVVSIAPVRKLSALKKQVYTDTVFCAENASVLKNRSLFELNKTKSLKEASIVLAQKDSFGLVVNLRDSSMLLMLKGVEIHNAKIHSYKIDQFFKALNPLVYTNLFSRPLRVKREFSTIIKEPIIERKAPKDTIEALNNAYMPDTLVQNPTYLRMELDHGFCLDLVQPEFDDAEGRKVERQFQRDLSLRKIGDQFRNFIYWNKSSYTPTIILYINADEIRSVYRAIPSDAQVILSY